MAENEHITIPMKVYKQLLRDSRVLEVLEAGGEGAGAFNLTGKTGKGVRER